MASNGVKAGYWLTSSHLPASDINTKLFTHLFCGYAGINADTYEVAITPSGEAFPRDVKNNNPEVITLLSIGGNGAKPECIAAMASGDRKAFIKSSIYVAREHKYDGLDFHWLYPRSIADMNNLGALLLEWREAIAGEANSDRPQLLLVVTVYFKPSIDWPHYPVDEMQQNLDWVNLITYDFYTPTSFRDSTAPTAPFHNPATSDFHTAIDGFVDWVHDFPPEKIVFGIPFHGWAWKLDDAKQNDLSSPAQGPAEGPCISTDGFIEYSNIKKFKLDNKVFSTVKEEYPVAYVYFGTTWIAYDNEYTIVLKIREAKGKFKLLGYFASNIANDDEENTLANAAFRGWDGSS